jgi:LysR family transcriptional regulator, nitrogen assimilation regulatory protein
MELRGIQYFLQIADEGSITRTAQKLGVAQPALTRHVQQLEAELGTQLLVRLPRGVRLTTAGRDFLEYARRIVLEVSRAKEHVRGVAKAPRGRVVIGTSPTLAPLLLPGCITRTRQQCPLVTLQVMEGFSPQLLDALLTGRLDVAVMTNPPRSPALALTPLISEPLVVLAPPGARGSEQAFSPVELSRTPIILSEGMRGVIDEQLASFGVQLKIEAEVDSVEAIRRLLLAGIGTTVMPVSAFHEEIAAGRLAAYPIEGANLHRMLVLARPVVPARSAAIDEIEHIVRTEMNSLLERGLFRLPARPPAPAAKRRRPSSRGPRADLAGRPKS